MIVAHGSPSAPGPAEAPIRRLARAVGDLLPGRRVVGATLATPGSLEAAVAAAGAGLAVYPIFMSDGWFVSEALPARLAAAGRRDVRILAPLGRDPSTWSLCLAAALDGAARHGLPPRETALLIAAHGSPVDLRPRDAADRAAAFVAAAGRFREVRTGFVDQDPRLEQAARIDGPALCLPFFAARAGHVAADLPRALRAAGFSGPLLDPIGTHLGVPRIIALALTAEAARRAA